jgi:hypothetical protein
MKHVIFVLVLLLSSVCSFSQQQINLKDAAAYKGDTVLVCGMVSGGRYFSGSKDSLTLLNLGAAYPNQQLTIVIGPEARKEFKDAPETFFKDKQICIYGRISLYNNKPQIILYHQDQLVEAIKQ